MSRLVRQGMEAKLSEGMSWDEVNDPEWLISWSINRWWSDGVVYRPGYTRARMFVLKAEDDREHDTNHYHCLDAAASTQNHNLSGPIRVKVYDEDGNFLYTSEEWFD